MFHFPFSGCHLILLNTCVQETSEEGWKERASLVEEKRFSWF
ncbi:hypothetical protein Gotri_014467 [Gossypium trilobum]|uniref:Uncharacterized protein n=1 Tax=Gossypium trilobum TaxID=34281 RepID=A0A7J9DWW8_9ROSI|nr:hypothetical protein [Gossypium trilobum]